MGENYYARVIKTLESLKFLLYLSRIYDVYGCSST